MKTHPLIFVIVLPILIAISGCETEDRSHINHSNRLPSGFLNSSQVKSYKNTSFNCESAIFKINDDAIKKFLANKTSTEFILSEDAKYERWEETPTNSHDTMVSGKCAQILFGDDYLNILESKSSYYTSHRQKFLLFNPRAGIIYYVRQGN